MNIYAKPGDKVKPIFKNGKLQHGYDHERIEASKYLEEGKIYTVRKTSVSSWSSLVTLEEIPDKSFNTVHFEDYAEPIDPELISIDTPSEGEEYNAADHLLREMESGAKKERLFTLAEALEIWDACSLRRLNEQEIRAKNTIEMAYRDKQQYFKERFNIDLNK